MTIRQALFEEVGIMKIPKEARIPAFVLGVEAAMLAGLSLIFFVLLP